MSLNYVWYNPFVRFLTLDPGTPEERDGIFSPPEYPLKVHYFETTEEAITDESLRTSSWLNISLAHPVENTTFGKKTQIDLTLPVKDMASFHFLLKVTHKPKSILVSKIEDENAVAFTRPFPWNIAVA